ncbi:phakinin isoform X1 [Pangasianodon hypophthalmus]|uniref:phakinin isoform X1 n=1 Tax=Pangasianodon hypophthalmus TaxID=310915 RepID=UPI0023073FDE|nr:phakinin isoform X1 [Pangasianodon hypophthalmus]
MPLPRRRSSILGQAGAERPGSVSRVSTGSTTSPQGTFVGSASSDSTSCLGARVSRRALGISSVFLQGLRSTSAPVLPKHAERGHLLRADGLNSCLLEYRDKVHTLEQLNQQLEEQIHHCLDRKASSAKMWSTLRQEWEDIYRQVSEAILDNARLVLQTENVQANAEDHKERFEHEQPFRKAMEEEISALYKVIDNANFTRMDLENQIESMNAELLDLAKTHEEDVKQVYNQLASHEVDELEPPTETSLEQILTFIHSHWEKVIEKTRAETDAYLECKKVDSVDKKLSQEEKVLENLKTECNDANAKIQSLHAETESMRALKRGLENSLNDAKHWHDIELQNLGSVIGKLEAELSDVRGDIEQQQRDYETLLNNKKRLEMEIGSYHGILEGEENRFHSSLSMCGSAEAEDKTQPFPEQQSSTDADGTADGTGS